MAYRYDNVLVKEVKDADTIVVDLDCGFHIFLKDIIIRFSRINAWETRGAEKDNGVKAKNYIKKRLESKIVSVDIQKPHGKNLTDSFGRYIAEVYLDRENLSDTLCKLGHARYQKY